MQSPEEIVRTYAAAWGETDPDRRRAQLESCWADGGVYSDPLSHVEGRDELDKLIAGFQASSPGATIVFASGVDGHHQFVRFKWRMVGADGATVVEGFDVGELAEDGRLQRITGFFGPFAPVAT